ncbi:hypothetical protein D8S78_19765 [Natrialba swarupiae]|nr:hypothetical protein [Natrialba swarupiae]
MAAAAEAVYVLGQEMRRRNASTLAMDVLYLFTTAFLATLAVQGVRPAIVAALPPHLPLFRLAIDDRIPRREPARDRSRGDRYGDWDRAVIGATIGVVTARTAVLWRSSVLEPARTTASQRRRVAVRRRTAGRNRIDAWSVRDRRNHPCL